MKQGIKKAAVLMCLTALVVSMTSCGSGGSIGETTEQLKDKAEKKYNELADRLDALHSSGRIFMIAPSVRPTVSRVESNMEKLGELYYLGYNDAREQLRALREYLK